MKHTEPVIKDIFWRYITNVWCLVCYVVIVYDFLYPGVVTSVLASVLVVYVSLLVIFVGVKEFERWYDDHSGKHPGELFVIGWTLLIIGLFIAKIVMNKQAYVIPEEVLSTYIAVLSIMAITQKSKKMKGVKKKIAK
jgi:hypothetical protein